MCKQMFNRELKVDFSIPWNIENMIMITIKHLQMKQIAA